MTSLKRFLTLFFVTILAVGVWGASPETLNIGTYATANSWSDATQYTSATAGIVTFTATGGGNTGKYYTTDDTWRFYANESATLTVSVPAGNTLTSVTMTYSIKDNGIVQYSSSTCTSGSAVSVSGTSAEFAISQSSGSKGKVFFTEITVAYTSGGGSCTTKPTVTAGSNSSVTATTATLSCASGISSLGSAGCSISSYGFVIGTSANPSLGGSGTTTHEVGTSYTTTGTSFSKDLTSLTAGTTYYARPYATNGKGTAYGIQTSFTTSSLPKYTVRFYKKDGTYEDKTEASAGAGVTPPAQQTPCGGWNFQGWSTSYSNDANSTTVLALEHTSGTYYPSSNITLYSVYTKVSGGGSSLTKMVTGNTLSNGDNIVIVAGGYALYQETTNSNYVANWEFTGADPVVGDIDDDKKYLTVTTGSDGKWQLGDGTNGYLRDGGSNKLYADLTTPHTEWTFQDNGDGTFALISTSYLSCRTDLTGTNENLWRGGGAAGTSGSAELTLYKYANGTTYYYSYPTCVECGTPTLSFADATLTKKISESGFTNTLTIGSNLLGATISYSSSNTSKATVNSSGVVTLLQSTTDGSPVTITATLPYTENGAGTACQNEVTATYTLNIKNDITWIVNEVATTAGSPTTSVNYNGTISAIPTTPAAPSACNTKSFVGWTTIADWDSDEAPDPLYPDLASFSSLKIRNNMTFYAVFANTTTGDPVSTLTQTLEYDTWTYTGTTTDKDTYRLFGDGAYIYSAEFDLSKLSQVVLYGGYYGGDWYGDYAIKSASGTTWDDGYFTTNNQNKAYTLTSDVSLSGTQALRIYSTSGNGTSSGARFTKVEIYTMVASTVGTAYVTKCCSDWADPTMTVSKNSFAVGDDDATIMKTSGGTHGTLSYTTSNASIATVSKSGTTGTVHAVSPGNVTITANWTKDGSYCAKEMAFNFTITGDVTITFDANGGTGTMASQVVSYATLTSLNTMTGLSKTGMTFVGWNTAADGSGTSYSNGANVKLTTNTTLYAQWGTTCTITLHRNGETQAITVLSSEIPYALPTAEADYCDAWQFDGWNAGSAVANNSDSYTKVAYATGPVDAHFYAVYRGNGSQADAYVRITKTDALEANKQYIFVGLNSGTKYVMPNTFNSTYHNISGIQIDEDGKDYYLKPTIETSYSGCVYYIKGSTDAWYIQNKNSSSYYINTSVQDFYTTTTSHDTYTITPNGLFWTVYNNYGSSCYGAKPYLEFYKSGGNYLFAKANDTYGSAALQIYKLGKVQLYKYTSTPSGGDCSLPCDPSGAEFTYPSMEKSTASANFTNTVIYTQKRNTTTPAYSSSDTDVAEIVNTATGEVHIKKKGETTITMTQGRDNTDPLHPICGVTLSYELTVTDPSLEVVEVTADDKLIIEHDFDGITEASVDSSKVDLKGIFADDIFISKYYEAASHMKLFALYNGTEHSIDLSQLRVRSGSSSWGDHGVVTLSQHPKIAADYPDFQLPSLTEIIFWSNTEGEDNNAQLCSCVSMEIDGKTYDYDDMKADRVPGWYHVETGTGITRFNFNGDDGLILERSTDGFESWTVIDLLGAGTKAAPATPTGSGNGVVHTESRENTTSSDLNDTPGGYYWDATSAAGKVLSTNRFYLMRLSDVHSGYDAVEKNTESFVTLGEEWTGRGIGGGGAMVDFCGSGDLFSEVAQYDYAKYYTAYVPYEDKWTAHDNGDGTFTIQFNSGELAKLSCKQLQITVKDAVDNSKTAQVEYRVPIIVASGSSVTTDELFNKHDKDECKVCDVAILNGGVLEKSKPTTPAQVAADREQVYNVDVYGGGELYIPSGTTYTVNTLTIRSKGDAVGVVDVQGKLIRNNHTLIHSKRFHNVGADWRWYYFSLPYDCNVSEVTFSNGDPAVHGVDFEIDWYDGASRASSQANGNWRSIATHPEHPNIIKAGYGYTIAVEEKTGHQNISLIFPMANFTEATQVPVSVGNWGAGDDDVPVNHKGWNVVGNPFLTRYKAQEGLDINGELRAGELVYSGNGWTQTDNGINYATIPINGGQDSYYQEALTNRNFDPFQSFIIQVGGDAERNDLAVQLKNAYKYKHPYSIVQRQESEYEVDENTPVWLRLNLNNANGESDQTTILISDHYTAEYDMQRDLAKWRGTSYKYYTRPVLASVYGGHELAFDALPDSIVADRVPLTYYSRNAGTMRFELSGAYNWQALEEVILYDAQKNTQHNLLTSGAYEFQAAAGEVGNRFSISAKVNRRKEPTIHTDIDLVDMQNVVLTVQDRNLLINGLEEGTTVYVFDMSGRLVGRQTGQTFMRFTVPATGVYNVRLEGQQAGITLRAIVQ